MDPFSAMSRPAASETRRFDFREGKLPKGVRVGGSGVHKFVKQKNGSYYLELGDRAYLRVDLSSIPPSDKRPGTHFNAYSITMDVKLDKLPTPTLALVNGMYPKPTGPAFVKVDKEGRLEVEQKAGRTKLKAGKGSRITVTLSGQGPDPEMNNRLKTYIDAKPCTDTPDESAGTVGPFSIPKSGLLLFASSDPAAMKAGTQIRYLEFWPGTLTEKQVRNKLWENAIWSSYNKKLEEERKKRSEKYSLSEVFPSVSQKKLDVMWRDRAFFGAFGDPYIENTELEGGWIGPSVAVMGLALRRVLASQRTWLDGFRESDFAALERICGIYKDARDTMNNFDLIKVGAATNSLPSFIRKWRAKLDKMAPGDIQIAPGGWMGTRGGHAITYVIERTDSKETKEIQWRFVLCNTGQGIGYHPTNAQSPPKMKYKCSVALNGISDEKMRSDTFWTFMFRLQKQPSPQNTPDKVYELLLPWLANKPFFAAIAESASDPHCDWRSPQRAGTCYFRCIVETTSYLMRRCGLTKLKSKQVSFVLRRELLRMAASDLAHAESLRESDVRLLNIACRQLAHSAMKQARDKTTTVAHVAAIKSFVDKIDENVRMLPCVDANSVAPPPLLELEGKFHPNAELFPFFDRLVREEDVEGLVGSAIEQPRYVPVNLLKVPASASTYEDAVQAIRWCDELCDLISSQSHCIRNVEYLIVSLIARTFTEVVPLPKPKPPNPVDYEKKYATQLEQLAAMGFSDKKQNIKVLRTCQGRVESAVDRLSDLRKEEEKKKKEETDAETEGKQSPGDDGATDEKSAPVDGKSVPADGKESKSSASKSEEKSDGKTKVDPEEEAAVREAAANCIWDIDMTYSRQLDILIRLWRLAMHFAANVFSIRHTYSSRSRQFDGLRITVMGCIAALADCIVRKKAGDFPSDFSVIYGGSDDREPFGISVAAFARQTEKLEMASPELLLARSAVLDYFKMQDTPPSRCVYSWENSSTYQVDGPMSNLLGELCAKRAYSPSQPMDYVTGKKAEIVTYCPEFPKFRDIIFHFKYQMVTNSKALPAPGKKYTMYTAKLQWQIRRGRFVISSGLFNKMPGMICTSSNDRLRAPSPANAAAQTAPEKARNEDDILHIKRLPDFGKTMSQKNSELLLSYLTVPYLRLPLILGFFASDDRIQTLRNAQTQAIVNAVVFEPGVHLGIGREKAPKVVPTKNPDLLATPYGFLLNDLVYSPGSVLSPLVKLVKLALGLDTGTVYGDTFPIMNYVFRLAARVERFTSFMVAIGTGKHPRSGALPRNLDISSRALAELTKWDTVLGNLLRGGVRSVLEQYLTQAINSIKSRGHKAGEDTITAAKIQSTLLMIYGTVSLDRMNEESVAILLCAFIFLTVRHTWNANDTLPEPELFQTLETRRRDLLSYLQSLPQGTVNRIFDAALRVSSGTGTRDQVSEHMQKWGIRKEVDCAGRYVVTGVCKTAEQVEVESAPETKVRRVSKRDITGEEINVQTMQLTFKSSHMCALPEMIARARDVRDIFGSKSMQCVITQRAKNRVKARIVGRNHEIHFWPTADERLPEQKNLRFYDPADLLPHEQWIVPIFEPFRAAVFEPPPPQPPIPFFIREDPVDKQATCVRLEGLDPKEGGVKYEVFVFKQLRCCNAFMIQSHGRRLYRTQIMATDAHFALADLQPSPKDRKEAWPEWGRHFAKGGPATKVGKCVIFRNPEHYMNQTGETERYIPANALTGLMPEMLLCQYRFWQDTKDNLRGYPKSKSNKTMVIVRLLSREGDLVDCTREDSISATIRRVPYEAPEDPNAEKDAEKDADGDDQDTDDSEAKKAPEGKLDDTEYVLLDLVHSRKGTPLFSLMKLISRLDRVGTVLVWRKTTSASDQIDLVEVPRLKLKFRTQVVNGALRLASLDHVGYFVSNERSALTTRLIRGVPHAVILSNADSEMQILVPNIDPIRPNINGCPFTTELVLQRGGATEWDMYCKSKYYLYQVHISLSFMFTPSLASALYLLLLRFNHRQYKEVFELANTIGTDVAFKPEEMVSFRALGRLNKDCHPDAHACRLKIYLVTLDSPMTPPWSLPQEMTKYLLKLSHVSAACRLTDDEEMQLLESCDLQEHDDYYELDLKQTTMLIDNGGVPELKDAKEFCIEFWFSHSGKNATESNVEPLLVLGEPPQHSLAILFMMQHKTARAFGFGGGARPCLRIDFRDSEGKLKSLPVMFGRGFDKTKSGRHWHHVCVTLNKGTLSVFVDGMSLRSRDGVMDSLYGPVKPLTIGGPVHTKDGINYDRYLDGGLDEVRIFNRVRDAKEFKKAIGKRMQNEDPDTCPVEAEKVGLVRRYAFLGGKHPRLNPPDIKARRYKWPGEYRHPSKSPLAKTFDATVNLRNRKWYLEAARSGETESKCDTPRLKKGPEWTSHFNDTALGKSLSDKTWSNLRLKYQKVTSLASVMAMRVIGKWWDLKDDTKGKMCGFGFLFLYSCMTESFPVKIAGNVDSFDLGSLCVQLLTDKHEGRYLQSILHLMWRNREWALKRLPKLVDRRSQPGGGFGFGGRGNAEWKGNEAPLKELLTEVVKIIKEDEKTLNWGPCEYKDPPEPANRVPLSKRDRFRGLLHLKKADEKKQDLMNGDRSWISPTVSNCDCSKLTFNTVDVKSPVELIMDVADRRALATKPLSRLGLDAFLETRTRRELNKRTVSDAVPFDVSGHPQAKSQIALDIRSRIGLEMKKYADGYNKGRITKLKGLLDQDMKSFAEAPDSKNINSAIATLGELERLLQAERLTDQTFMLRAVPYIDQICNGVDVTRFVEGGRVTTRWSDGVTATGTVTELKKNVLTVTFGSDADAGFYVSLRSILSDAGAASVDETMKKLAEKKLTTPDQLAALGEVKLRAALTSIDMDSETADALVKRVSGKLNFDAKVVLRDESKGYAGKRQSTDKENGFCEVYRADAEIESSNAELRKYLFILNRYCGRETRLELNYIIAALLSTEMEFDLRKINPFLTPERARHVRDVTVGFVVKASRVGQINRCLSGLRSLRGLLRERLASGASAGAGALAGLINKTNSLIGNLNCERYFMKDDGKGSIRYDPRFLVFEFTWNIVLRKKQVRLVNEFMDDFASGRAKTRQMIMGAGKTTVVCPLLTLMLADGDRLLVQMVPRALLPMSRSVMRNTFSSIVYKRVYTFSYDRGTDYNKQLHAKLEMAKRTRGVVCTTPTAVKSLALKYVETLDEISTKTTLIAETQAERIKLMKKASAETKSSEELETDGSRDLAEKIRKIDLKVKILENASKGMVSTLQLFKQGVLIMDEVDLILHPLKSELNFPIGQKFPLDFNPERWELVIHMMDAVFFAETGKMSVDFTESGKARKILASLSLVLDEGYRLRALQRSPHVILLNNQYYQSDIKPVLAQWCVLWLEAQGVLGSISEKSCTQYILEGGDVRSLVYEIKKAKAQSEEAKAPEAQRKAALARIAALERKRDERQALRAEIAQNLKESQIKMLNLGHEWLTSYLPHTLRKIDRVTFGIMTKEDHQRALSKNPTMPESRFKLAIPFVGKDVPSESSEFAHPDVIVGLTILGYRYEGLRWADFQEIIVYLRGLLTKEVGPAKDRKAYKIHAKWVKAAGGVVRAAERKYDASGKEIARKTKDSKSKDRVEVVPLDLLKTSNVDEMKKLYKLIRKQPRTIHWYLREFVFPAHMRHQVVKLSACGQEVGGSMLFGSRLGFSGTPSSLMPIELGKCGYEAGADGLYIHTLTNRDVCSYELIQEGWDVESLLNKIAGSNPVYRALIDTGALVTGMSNKQVASYLLDHGLEGVEGVVYLDENDDKMILVRATRSVQRLEQCGIAKEKRFAFYDQVHTTGMDIRHVLDAKAVLTLGKDMTFRDYAQGAFRMRGINKGQKIHLFIIPEVAELIKRELGEAAKGLGAPVVRSQGDQKVLDEVAAWQIINQMRLERVQYNMLQMQNLSNLYRKNAFKFLTQNYARLRAPGGKMDPEIKNSIQVFRENIDFTVAKVVPEPKPYDEVLKAMLDDHRAYLSDDEYKVGMGIVNGVGETLHSLNLSSEITKESEKEQEQEQEQQQEQEIEIEKFVDLAYRRENEEPTRWGLERLKGGKDHSMFYPCREFALRGQAPIQFPDYLMASTNYFDKLWAGDRRIKNVIMVLEWVPSKSALRVRRHEQKLSQEQETELRRSFDLFDFDHSGSITAKEMSKVLEAALDVIPSKADVKAAMTDVQLDQDSSSLSFEELKRVLVSGLFKKVQDGRKFVALSLAEAETLRRVIHLRGDRGLFDGADTGVALRCLPGDFGVVDKSSGFEPGGRYQEACGKQSFRFLDCEMFYKPGELNVLLQSLSKATPEQRLNFYSMVMGCRRRLRRKWSETPVAKVFTLPSEYNLLKLRAAIVRIYTAITSKGLLLHDAFTLFDSNDDGYLHAAELYGAVEFLGIRSLTPRDILDLMRHADVVDQDRKVSYEEFVQLLRDPADKRNKKLGLTRSNSSTYESDGTSVPSSPAGDFLQMPKLAPRWSVTPSVVYAQEHGIKPKGEAEFKVLMEKEVELEKKAEELERKRLADAERVRKEEKKRLDEKIRMGIINPPVETDFSVKTHVLPNGESRRSVLSTRTLWDFTKKVLPTGVQAKGNFRRVEDPEFEGGFYWAFDKGARVDIDIAKANGHKGARNLNIYTITMEIMIDKLPNGLQSLLQTSKDSAGTGVLFLGPQGKVVTFRGSNPGIKAMLVPKKWTVVSMMINTSKSTIAVATNGIPHYRHEDRQSCYPDGEMSIQSGFSLFASGTSREMGACKLRRVWVHTEALKPSNIKSHFDQIPKPKKKEAKKGPSWEEQRFASPEMLSQVMAITGGFKTRDECIAALVKAKGNLDRAVNSLFGM